jgi:hypothetical protein
VGGRELNLFVGGQNMGRIFESWWWSTIMVIAFIAWGFLTPSDIREEPNLAIASYVALSISLIMCFSMLGSWILRVRQRAH